MGNRVIVVGSSQGGIQALVQLVGDLPACFAAPILIVQHVAAESPGYLPQILSRAGLLPAKFPKDGDELEPGVIYIAPPNRHMLLEANRIRLSHGPKENRVRPAVDPLFRSAALSFGARVVGVVLTGQLDDGTAGLLAIKDGGGTTVVQEPDDAVAPSMPRSALRRVAIDHRRPLATMGSLLAELAADPQPAAPSQLPPLLELECRIASGASRAPDWRQLEQLGTPSGLSCPECMAALYELQDPRLLRHRCRAGHAFSPQSLAVSEADAHERQLSALYATLLEEAALARRLLARDANAMSEQEARRLAADIARFERQAELLQASIPELVDPSSTPP